jgi:hypothetical protein
MRIVSNIRKVKEKIVEICSEAGLHSEKIALVAATKNRDVSQIKEAVEAGIKIIGENRLQEAKRKMAFLNTEAVEWQFIGHLQTNKVKQVIELFGLIQSVDSQHLIEEINRRALTADKKMRVLIEVNVAKDPKKYGLPPGDVLEFIRRNSTLEGVSIQGLMTIAPMVEPEKTRPYFRKMKELFELVKAKEILGVKMEWLSMGMSDDFPVAVEEGSNMLRLGRAIFQG